MHRNIFAFTAPGAEYPEYLSINETEGQIQVTVRGPKKAPTGAVPYVLPGDGAFMTLPRDQVQDLIVALQAVGIFETAAAAREVK